MKACIVFILALTVCHVSSGKCEADEHWEKFKHYHNSRNPRSVKDHHKSKFLKCKKIVDEHNEKFRAGKVSFRTSVNLYSIKGAPITCSNCDPITPAKLVRSAGNEKNLSESVDWRSLGVISPVQNQNLNGKQCGSCWAFSAIGSIEAHYAIKFNESLPNLSEQELVDCPFRYNTYACKGGTVQAAYNYIMDKGGLVSEKDYPYEAKREKCDINSNEKIPLDIAYYEEIPPGDEEELKSAVAERGPVSVSIDARHPEFRDYREGVYYQKDCLKINVTHAVLVVGYGTDERYGDYWLVKNSWGPHWGENGYVRMSRNRNNNCGIATYAVYPVLGKKKSDKNLGDKDGVIVTQALKMPKVCSNNPKIGQASKKKNRRRCPNKN